MCARANQLNDYASSIPNITAFALECLMEKITLSTTLVNNIMAYLGTRPFQEVFQLIQEVQKEAQAQQPEISNPSLQWK